MEDNFLEVVDVRNRFKDKFIKRLRISHDWSSIFKFWSNWNVILSFGHLDLVVLLTNFQELIWRNLIIMNVYFYSHPDLNSQIMTRHRLN